jgi:hypothetical protein
MTLLVMAACWVTPEEAVGRREGWGRDPAETRHALLYHANFHKQPNRQNTFWGHKTHSELFFALNMAKFQV